MDDISELAKDVTVPSVPIAVLERARQAAMQNGAGRTDAAAIRYALYQFVRSLAKK